MTSSKFKYCKTAIWFNLKLGYASVTPTFVYYCILLYSAFSHKDSPCMLICTQIQCVYNSVCGCARMCVCVCACWMCMCVCACVFPSMCVVVITPKMEWNQLEACYILPAFPLSLVCYTHCFTDGYSMVDDSCGDLSVIKNCPSL